MSSSNSPGAIPCPVGPTTSAAVIVPVTVPLGVGHTGLPPPPQRNTATPPLVDRLPKWMWATVAAASRPVYESVYSIVPVLSSMLAKNEPVATEETAAGVASWYPVSGSECTIVLPPATAPWEKAAYAATATPIKPTQIPSFFITVNLLYRFSRGSGKIGSI